MKRADPRIKIIAVLAWSILLALNTEMDAAMAGLGGSALLISLSGLPARDVINRLLIINIFIVFIWLALPFSFSCPGDIIAAIGPLEVTSQGMRLAQLLTVKGNAVALGAIAFLGTSTVIDLTAAARRLGAPEKMTTIFILMFRYVQVIGQEYGRLRLAMKVRGFKAGMNIHTYRSLANLVGLLLIRSLDRADRVHAAMLCRGYKGHFWLTNDFHFQKIDLVISFLMLILVGGVLYFVFA